MIYWLLERVLRRGYRSRRGVIRMGHVEDLAGSGTAAWFLAQEKARLEYLAAKEQYERQRSWRSFQHLMERLLQLQSTNAIIQSLMQERLLEQMTAGAAPDDSADVVSKTRGAA